MGTSSRILSAGKLNALQCLSSRLGAAGLTHGLGGSGLLYALGCPIPVHDWDLLTDASESSIRAALPDVTIQFIEPRGIFASRLMARFEIDNQTFDLIGDFALRVNGARVRIPLRLVGDYHGVPLCHPADWLQAYRILLAGRQGDPDRLRLKVDWLEDTLET